MAGICSAPRACRTGSIPGDRNYDHDWPTWRQMLPLYLDDLMP